MRNLLLLMSLILPCLAISQTPDYLISIKNEQLISSKELQFDVYIKSVGSNAFEYASFQAGINISSKFLNGGTLTIDTVSSYSDFNVSKQTPVINKPSSSWDATNNRIRIIAQQPPGAGNGKIISQNGDGSRLARFKITNSTDFDTLLPNLSFNFGSAISWTTKLYAYINGVSTEITDQTKITSYSTSIVLQEPKTISNSIVFSDVQTNGIQIKFNERTNAQNILVLLNATKSPTYIPKDGDEFSANQSYVNAQILSDSSRVIYEGDANASIDIAGLNEKTKYYITAYLFNGSGSAKNILTTASIKADTLTKASTINNPIVHAILPEIGNIHDTIQVIGTKLFPVDSIYFGKSKVNLIDHKGDSVLVIAVPEGEASNLIKVYTSYGTSNSPKYFTILPSISSIDNTPAEIGKNILIQGFNFEGVDSVKIGIISQDIVESTNNTILFNLKYYNKDEVVHVYCKNGNITSSQKIRFKPSILDINPRIGTTNDPIQITGKNLYNIDSVLVGNVKAQIIATYPDSLLTISIPAMAVTSKLTVYTKNGRATSNDSLNIVSGIAQLVNDRNIVSYFNLNNDLLVYSKNAETKIHQIQVLDLKGQLIFQTSENKLGELEMSISNENLAGNNFIVLLVKTNRGVTIFKKIK